MNAEDKKALAESMRRNPFWVCLIVFALLACERGLQLAAQLDQRQQLEQTLFIQGQNQSKLVQSKQLEMQLQGLSVELVQMSKTNSAANQIVQDFNIQWTPNPAPLPVASKPSK